MTLTEAAEAYRKAKQALDAAVKDQRAKEKIAEDAGRHSENCALRYDMARVGLIAAADKGEQS